MGGGGGGVMQIPKKYQACASGLKKKSCRIVKMEKYRAAVIRARERIFALRVTAPKVAVRVIIGRKKSLVHVRDIYY